MAEHAHRGLMIVLSLHLSMTESVRVGGHGKQFDPSDFYLQGAYWHTQQEH